MLDVFFYDFFNIYVFVNPFNSVAVAYFTIVRRACEQHDEQLTQIIENENIHRTDLKTFDGLKKIDSISFMHTW